MAKLSVDQTLLKAKSHTKRGEIEEAHKLYQNVLQAFPNNGRAQKGLEALRKTKAPATNQNPPQELLDRLLGHFQNGRFDDAEKLAVSITQKYPRHQVGWKALGAIYLETGKTSDSLIPNQKSVQFAPSDAEAHFSLGNSLKKLGRLDEAEASYSRAIALKTDYAEAHNNLGNTLQELGRLDEAEASYMRALALKPNYAKARNNLGNTLQELGRLDEAEASYMQALALKPDYAEAYCNLGNALQELGRLDEAEARYLQALALEPEYAAAQHNLVQFLACHNPQKNSSQPIVKVDQEIKEVYSGEESAGILSDEQIIRLLYKCSNIIKKHGLNLGTELSQTYRHNSVDLNCTRHMQIFEKFTIIPEFCFGCYKVQIEPRSIIELIKLFVLFNQIKLPKNNIRKCMVEMRPEVSGFYKGFIYCSSLEEAFQISDYVDVIIQQRFKSKLPLVVKRGCSEYSLEFPDYNAINKSGPKLMKYNENWKLIEKDYDSKNPTKYSRRTPPSPAWLSLSDVLIIRKWIDYAKGLGDPSAQLLNHTEVVCQKVYRIAETRMETCAWREPSWVK